MSTQAEGDQTPRVQPTSRTVSNNDGDHEDRTRLTTGGAYNR